MIEPCPGRSLQLSPEPMPRRNNGGLASSVLVWGRSVGLRVHFTYLRKSISHEVKEVIQLNNYTKLNCHLQAEVVTLMKLK